MLTILFRCSFPEDLCFCSDVCVCVCVHGLVFIPFSCMFLFVFSVNSIDTIYSFLIFSLTHQHDDHLTIPMHIMFGWFVNVICLVRSCSFRTLVSSFLVACDVHGDQNLPIKYMWREYAKENQNEKRVDSRMKMLQTKGNQLKEEK